MRALRDGTAPDGSHYFPAFPYPSYTGISERDMRDLKAYIFSLPADVRENRPHDDPPPFGWRFLVEFWKWLYFTTAPRQADQDRGADWNRRAYLVQVLGRCGECHTPRDLIGGREADMAFAGTDSGPHGGSIPNITPDPETGLGRWSAADFQSILEMGMKPDGDFVDSEMAEVVENSTGKLTPSDRDAIITYLRSLAPIRHHVAVKSPN